MNTNRNVSRISSHYRGKISGKNNYPLKIYSQNKKATMVYPAHVSFDFVTSLAFLFVLNLTPTRRLRPSIQYVFRQCPKLETNSNYKLLQNRLIISRLHAVSALRIYSSVMRVIFVSFSIYVMLFYRQNHKGNIVTKLIYSLNVTVLSTFSYFRSLCWHFQKSR